jgi:hypothetical protein
MKKFFSTWIVLTVVLFVGVSASAQGLVEDFTGTASTQLVAAGWTISGTSVVNPLTITASGLTFSGYASSGIGNGVPMANNGQDVYKSFTAVSSDSLYLAFMANVSAALTGDYFIALSPSASQTNYYARLHVKATTGGFLVGVSKSNEVSGGAQYGSTVFSLNTTYLFVVKYKFVPNATAADTLNDQISVFVVPSSTDITTEPATPEIAKYTSATKADALDLSFVTLRQGSASAAPTLTIDGIRIAKSWTTATQTMDTVNVTFLVNTATIPDTLLPTSTVQLRGSLPGFTWDNNSVLMSNIGGDYWKVKVPFIVVRGTTLSGQFKIFTNVKSTITGSDGGWENNTTDGSGNRLFSFGPVNGTKDTVLSVEYANGSTSAQPQYWRPFVPETDSVSVWFRINMQSQETFNKATTRLGVRGDMLNGWGTTIILKQESNHGNAGQTGYDGTNFWSGVVKIPRTTAAATMGYKFVQFDQSDPTGTTLTWESISNRTFMFDPAMADTTLYWVWWNNQIMQPFNGNDTVIMTFRADLAQAVASNGASYTDTIVVRSGYNSSALAVREKRMFRIGISSKFRAVDTVITKSGTPLYYQYYRTPASGEVREIYYNFANPGASATAEKRRFMVPALANNTAQMIQDTINSTSDEHRMPRFRNMKNLAQAMVVTYTCDVRPAIYQLKKGSKLVSTNITAWTIANPDSVIIDGVWMNGPAVGGWDVGGAWGLDRRMIDTAKMWDDGTHGDLVAHDSIYSLLYSYTTSATVGQEFKFGIFGCDNEGGFGNNHIENINDANSTATIASQFGSIDPVFFDAWDYTNEKPVITDVNNGGATIPFSYRVEQNYPNPFNPTTRIDYEIKAPGRVSLKVFNVLGQVVASLVEEKKEAGKYYATFDASKLASGVYLYQFISGNYVATKKMILLK